MRHFRNAALIGAAALILAAGCSSSHAADTSASVTNATTTTVAPARTPKQAAVALGQRMLDDALLPDGGHVSTAPPPAHLDRPQQQPAMGNLVFAHRLWSVPGSPEAVQRWLEVHVPDGFAKSGTGSISGPGYRIVGVQDDLKQLPANTSTAEIQVAVAPDGSNSIVRVDALVGWTAPRPADEFVSAKDRIVTVRVVRAYNMRGGNPVVKTVVVTDPKVVGAIVKAFNALGVSPPNSVHSCPVITARTVSYKVEFSTAANAKPDLTATVGKCGGVVVTVAGHTAPALGELSSGAFADAVAHALGLPAPHFN